MQNKILIATQNNGKIKEIKNKLSSFGIEFVSLLDLEEKFPEPVEDGNTFFDNALIKAKYYNGKTGYTCLADDSGLSVDCLDGEPGIKSSRFAGENASDEDNIDKLIELLKGKDNKSAKFVCCMVLFVDSNRIISASGEVRGEIINIRRGGNGFGYDPVFYIPELGKTMAEISLEQKNGLSHRAKALTDLKSKLYNLNR
mgnify:CR=1 FL=1